MVLPMRSSVAVTPTGSAARPIRGAASAPAAMPPSTLRLSSIVVTSPGFPGCPDSSTAYPAAPPAAQDRIGGPCLAAWARALSIDASGKGPIHAEILLQSRAEPDQGRAVPGRNGPAL